MNAQISEMRLKAAQILSNTKPNEEHIAIKLAKAKRLKARSDELFAEANKLKARSDEAAREAEKTTKLVTDMKSEAKELFRKAEQLEQLEKAKPNLMPNSMPNAQPDAKPKAKAPRSNYALSKANTMKNMTTILRDYVYAGPYYLSKEAKEWLFKMASYAVQFPTDKLAATVPPWTKGGYDRGLDDLRDADRLRSYGIKDHVEKSDQDPYEVKKYATANKVEFVLKQFIVGGADVIQSQTIRPRELFLAICMDDTYGQDIIALLGASTASEVMVDLIKLVKTTMKYADKKKTFDNDGVLFLEYCFKNYPSILKFLPGGVAPNLRAGKAPRPYAPPSNHAHL